MISRTSLSTLRSLTSILSRFSPPLSNSTSYLSHRTFKSTSVHHQTPSQPSPQDPDRPTTQSFKPFQRPFFKVFLGAIFTYQVWYWAWTKLEMDDLKSEKQEELSALEKKARDLASKSGAS